MEGVGHITRGVDVRVGRAQLRVDDDPVVHLQARRLGELGVGGDADAHDDGIGVDAPTVGERDPAHPARGLVDLCDLYTTLDRN